MRWLVDENLPKGLVDWLRGRGDDVLDVADSPYRGASDQALWRLAARDGRVVITRDLGFPQWAVAPTPLGVVIVRVPDGWQAAQIISVVQRRLEQVDAGSLSGHVTVVQPGRIRQHPLTGLGRE